MTSHDPQTAERWVVGVDGSEGSEHALRWALAQASYRSVSVSVVRTWQPQMTGFVDLDLPYQMEQTPKAAQRELDELATELGESGPSIDWSVEVGSPTHTLLEEADLADLLVVGTRGRGGFARLLLGSVSHQCATHAPIPVAVVPASATLNGPIERMVVGIDGSDNAKSALRWALAFAQPGTTVLAIGTWEPSLLATEGDVGNFKYLAQPALDDFNEAIDEVSRTSERQDVTLETDFRFAKTAATLLEQTSTSDLLIVGARGKGWVTSAILGSVSTKVLHHATCPVVVVPDPAT